MPVPWAGGGTGRTFTQVLLGINVAVFIAMAMSGISVTEPSSEQLVQWGANAAWLTLSGEWWRLVTSMFLHIGIIHIAFNMWCLWDLGALCEGLYGSWTFLALYFISGIAGSLASAAWHPHGLSAGASGAIFGLAGALIASYSLGEFSLPRFVITSTLRSVLAFVGINLFLGFVSSNTDNAAHAGGLLAGAIGGALVALFAPDRKNAARRLVIILVLGSMVAGAWMWVDRTRGIEARLERASVLISQGNPGKAIPELQTIIRHRPDYIPAHELLVDSYFNLKQYDKAESDLKAILDRDPKNTWAALEMGSVYLNQNRTGEAKRLYQEALKKDPESANSHYGLGIALAAEENCPAAIQEYETAARLNTDAEGVYYEMGTCYLKLKQYDKAISAFQQEQHQSGDDSSIEAGLAEAFRGKGMAAEAQLAEEKAQRMKNAGTSQ
jgi:rhomboid protease GluP